jgi:hypothetical protein
VVFIFRFPSGAYSASLGHRDPDRLQRNREATADSRP